MFGSAVSPVSRALRRRVWLHWVWGLAFTLMLATQTATVGAQPPAAPPANDGEHGGHGGHGGDRATQEPTPEERAAADALVMETKAAASRFANVRAAEAEGFVQVTPFSFYGVRAAHFGNPAYVTDGRLLDPERPENLVYLKQDEGRLELLGVMYLAPIGQGPAVGGPLTEWHIHDDLCASAEPPAVVPILPTGTCPTGTTPIGYEMLHLWTVEHPDGPFAHLPPGGSAAGPLTSEETGGSLAGANSLVDWPALIGAIGQTLELSPIEIGRRFEAGESLAEMADAQGIERAALIQAVQRRMVADMNRALVAGDMTPGQHEVILRGMATQAERIVTIHRGEPWVVVTETD